MNSNERTVRAVVTSYVHPDGSTRFGLRGETVEIDESDLERFDAGEGNEPAPKPVVRRKKTTDG
jgi:hypothetical protein